MERTITQAYRDSVESRFSADVDLVFITISHKDLIEPIRLVNDTVDYYWTDGVALPMDYHTLNRWIGFPFEIKLLTDDDNTPEATLQVQNVDRRIGETIRGLRSPPTLKVELLASFDFDLTTEVDERFPLAIPTVEYRADALQLTDVQGDSTKVSGKIIGWNNTQRVWPGYRATADRTPGLYR